MHSEVLVFSHSVSPRLQYIIDFLSHYYSIPFRLIYDDERYPNTPAQLKINYSYHRLLAEEIFIHSHALLFETTVRPVKIECFEHNGNKAFFRMEGDAGFDLFAAIFYLLSRYEEYLPHKKDNYGRYAHENSIAFREGFLNIPLINIWLEDFRKLLLEKNTEIPITALQKESSNDHFSFLPTYDIDMAWCYSNKGFKRNAGAILLLLLKFKFRQAILRIQVVKGKQSDPYDAYEWLDELHSETGISPVYFFLVAKENGRYDRNINIHNRQFRSLVKDLASKYTVGLHPSWQSGDTPVLLGKEKSVLEHMSGQTVLNSRQHYIRFELPFTFQQLLANGIANDYSMGYGSINGFRASIASSFYWYDIKNETSTPLLLHPFCFMDANAFYEQGLNPGEAFKELMHYYEVVRSVNGTMITIWHNSFLGTGDQFIGWADVYKKFIRVISRAG